MRISPEGPNCTVRTPLTASEVMAEKTFDNPDTHKAAYCEISPEASFVCEMSPEFTVSSVDANELYCPRDGTKMTNVSSAAVVSSDGQWLVLDRGGMTKSFVQC